MTFVDKNSYVTTEPCHLDITFEINNESYDKRQLFTESAPSLIQSIGCNIRLIKKNVPSVDNRNQESWRLLVEERMASIGKLKKKKSF